MLLKSNCRDRNCACANCTAVNKTSTDQCKKYCEQVCRGQGKPLYEGPEQPKCSYFQIWKDNSFIHPHIMKKAQEARL